MNPIAFLENKMMLPILESAFNVTGSYGWAIVLLTVIIRMVLMPLTVQSHNSMKEMQKLQPKLKRIQERYRNKPEELNKKMVELYREHKVNPLGGCLPILIQMPFLFALYATLIGEKFSQMLTESGNTAFFFLADLSKKGLQGAEGQFHIDNILLLATFTLTTVLQQKFMTPSNPNADAKQQAVQKQMQIMMPIVITMMFVFIPVPTGIYLYLVISNVIGIVQYAYLNAQGERREAMLAEANRQNKTADKVMEALDEDEDEDDEAEATPVQSTPSNAKKHRVKKTKKKKKRK